MKKGNLGLLQTGILTLVIVGILLGIGIQVMDTTADAICAGDATCAADPTNSSVWTEAYNSTSAAVTATGNFSDWMNIIVVVIAGAVIFGLLAFLSMRRGRGTQTI